MRSIARMLINLALLLGAAAAIGWLTTLKAYHHASHDGRVAMLAVAAAAFFVVACLVLHAIPSKAQMARRKQAKRPSSPYAAPAGRK